MLCKTSLVSPASVLMSLILSTLTEKETTKRHDKDSALVDKNAMAMVAWPNSMSPLIQSARSISKDVASYWSEVSLLIKAI